MILLSRYDMNNRLTLTDYQDVNRQLNIDIRFMATPDYSSSYSYDIQGNVSVINRKGLSAVIGGTGEGVSANYGIVDKLTLVYSGNRLQNVSDEAPAVYYTGATDFDDAADEDVEYEYDSNGNMVANLNRGIAAIVYSSLNQPLRIEFADGKSIENIYDADGILLQRCLVNAKMVAGDVVRPANVSGELVGNISQVLATTTDYSGPWQFKNGKLDRINIPGGFVKGKNVYFYISDHQGNVRQVWNASTNRTVQDNHYYPYGSLFGESASTEYLNVISLLSACSNSNGEVGEIDSIVETDNQDGFTDPGAPIVSPKEPLTEISDNQYRYESKEWISFRGLNAYDFTARLYDPSLGRFHTPDPLNATYPHLSPYLYCAANPINATDPSGMVIIANTSAVQRMILNTLPNTDRKFVTFINGKIDVETMKEHKSQSSNYNSLLFIAENQLNCYVLLQDSYVYRDNENNLGYRYMGTVEYDECFDIPNPINSTGSTFGDTGFLGKTLLPGEGLSGQNSINENIYIIINRNQSTLGEAQTFGHEAYGHAYLYMKTNDREISGHKFKDGIIDSNKILVERIFQAIMEVITNNEYIID